MELKKRHVENESLRRENGDFKDLYDQAKLEVIEALQLADACSNLPELIQTRAEEHRRVVEEKDSEILRLQRAIAERDGRIATLEGKLRAAQEDLKGVCYVQSQLLNFGPA